MDKQSLELLLAQGESIERIARRFSKDPSTVAYWVKKHGLKSRHADRHAAKGGLERERLEGLVKAGMTIAEIAAEVGRSKSTVRHWMRVFELRSRNARGRRPKSVWRAAKNAGLLNARMVCRYHGETDFILEGRGYYRCKKCRSERVARRRRDVKTALVAEAGGRCVVCGYDRWVGALQFHHVDPSTKEFHIALHGVTRSLERARAEAGKCVLLCANCHAEVEAGRIVLPATVPASEFICPAVTG